MRLNVRLPDWAGRVARWVLVASAVATFIAVRRYSLMEANVATHRRQWELSEQMKTAWLDRREGRRVVRNDAHMREITNGIVRLQMARLWSSRNAEVLELLRVDTSGRAPETMAGWMIVAIDYQGCEVRRAIASESGAFLIATYPFSDYPWDWPDRDRLRARVAESLGADLDR